jgi:nitroreductase
MQLSRIDRALSRVVARPSAHGLLRAAGLLSVFAAEAPRTRSASAMLVLLAPHDEDPFDTGRRMYRLWLAATAAGWAGCPMSALADDPEANREVRDRLRLPESRRLVNVIRLGIPPERAYGRLTPRLPASELLVATPHRVL